MQIRDFYERRSSSISYCAAKVFIGRDACANNEPKQAKAKAKIIIYKNGEETVWTT